MMHRIRLALFATVFAAGLFLTAVQAFAQALPVCSWGDMIYKSSAGYACLPFDNTAGKFLQGQGGSAAAIWTFQAAQNFLLPTQATNTFLGNTTGINASPVPNTVSQILDTIGYDISRPPAPGAMIYKSATAPNNAWQALAPGVSGQVLSMSGGLPVWISQASASLDAFCTTQGAVLFRNSLVWQCLAPGSSGQFLMTNGASQDTIWQTVSATTLGAVPTSRLISSGTGLSGGGDLSADRTLSIANTVVGAGPIGSATLTPIITFNSQGQLTAVSSATTAPPFSAVTGQATLAQLPTMAANTTLSNGTGSSAVPTAFAMPSCSSSNSAIQWLSGTGWQCAALAAAGVASPGSSIDFDVACWNGSLGALLRDASTGFCLLPGGVKVTSTTDATSLSSLTGALQVTGGATYGKSIVSLATGGPAFQVATCNINAITQNAQPSNTQENLMFYDCTDTLTIGPTNDNGRTLIQMYTPLNVFKYSEKISFCQDTLDARLTKTEFNNAGTQTFARPCRLNYAPNTASTANGAVWQMNNMSLNMPSKTYVYFILNASDNRNMDIRFGLSEISAGLITGSGCYFKMTTGNPTSNMHYSCTDGGTTIDTDAGVNNIQSRRIYLLEIVGGTPAGGNPKVNFWCGDSNNVLQACGAINVGTAGLPNNSVNLVPFVSAKENNATLAWSISINEINLVTEQ